MPVSFTMEYQPLRDFICGTIAGCIASVVTHPLDLIRTRFVAQGNLKEYHSIQHAVVQIIKHEGIFGFYKGLLPMLLQTAPYTGLQFSFYNLTKLLLKEIKFLNYENNIIGDSLICGGIAGLGSKICVYPLDLIKKRLQIQGFEQARKQFGSSQHYNGTLNCMHTIFHTEGIKGFYKGLSPSLIKAMTVSALHFSIYELFCQYLHLRKL